MVNNTGVNVFLAAVYTNNYMRGQKLYENLNDHEKAITRNLPNILESWHYVGAQRYVDQMRADGAKVFLDSGAFSAWTLGATMSLPDYCEYIKTNMDILRVEDGDVMASVLDGIGDPLQTWRNQYEMELRGVRPLPCFHFGEPEEYLEHYVKNYNYITIGGMVGKTPETLSRWLDRMWDRHMVDGSGRAKIKVHGFGLTSIPLMERYPWYSCDSSSWIQATAFGTVVSPQFGPLRVSDKSPSRHDAGQHVCNLSQQEQEAVFRHFEQAGFTYERLSTVYESRAAFNLWAYTVIQGLVNAKNDGVFRQRIQELF